MSFKKIIIILIILAAAGGGIAYFTMGKKAAVEYVTAKVERGDIKQTVSETGTVKAAKEIELNFLNSGKIAEISVKAGDIVKKDQILAELDYSELLIKEKEQQANLEIAKANLAKVLAGASAQENAVSQAGAGQAKAAYDAALRELDKVKKTIAENIAQAKKTLSDLESKTESDITTYEQAIASAQTDLDNAKSTYQRAIDNKEDTALTAIDDKLAVAKTALDTINTIITDTDAKSVLSVKNTSYLDITENGSEQANESLTAANNSYNAAKLNKTASAINQALDGASDALNKTFTALNNCFNALENTITSSDFTQTDLDAYKTGVNTKLTNISAAISALQTAKQNLADAILDYQTNTAAAEKSLSQAQINLDNAVIQARNGLNTAKTSGEQQITSAESKADAANKAWQVAAAELEKIKAPARIESVALSQAQIKQAQAALDLIKNQINNSVIKAPISGTVTKVEYEAGEQQQAAKPAVNMVGENNFEIEVDVSEADIAKIKINDPAAITLDAFGEDVKFSGNAYFIEPAETVIQDVIYYKVKISFADKTNLTNIKPGMTANAVITTAQKSNVLMMPSRAVVEKNGADKIVRLLVNGQVSEVPVELGLRGDEGMVEVLSGVKEGDEVVTFVKENE